MKKPGYFDTWEGDAKWRTAGALSAPYKGGKPVDERDARLLTAVPFGNSGQYQLVAVIGDQMVPVYPKDAPLLPFLFSPSELIKATK